MMSSRKEDPVEVVKPEEDTPTLDDEYLHGTRLTALTVSLMLGMFLVALDNVRSHEILLFGYEADYILLDDHWHCHPEDYR
jgi:hypothetical protein